MAKLIMCKGLPGSGKSTWAKAEVVKDPDHTIRVNKDEIRIELGLDRGKWTRESEYAVVDRRDHLISEGLKAGKTVISDDTNFGKKHEPRLRELARKFEAEFEVNDSFLQVPPDDCVDRDSKRAESERVGKEVIMGMYETHILPTLPVPPVEIKGSALPNVVVCDLDGTLALPNGRNVYDATHADKDLVNGAVLACLRGMIGRGCGVVFVSGREDKFRQPTLRFLQTIGLEVYPLFMRKTGDFRNDAIIKREIYDAEIKDKYHVLFVLDDRDRVVKMWRDLGIPCFQVNYGAF